MKMLMDNGKPYRKYTFEFVKERAKREGLPDYELLSTTYKTRKDKLLWRHNVCNKTFLMSADGFFNRKNRCPHCRGGHRLSQEDFITKVNELGNNEYEVLSTYQTTHTMVLFRHKKCNKEFQMRPNNFIIKGNRCPFCISFSGRIHSESEDKIETWLKENSIKFEREVKFKETGRLRFDFKVYKKDNSFFLVEFDGRFHMLPKNIKDLSDTVKKKFESQQKNDKKKNDFCLENKIPLIRSSNVKTIIKLINNEFNDYPNGGEIPQ